MTSSTSNQDLIEIFRQRLRDNLGSYYPDLKRQGVEIHGKSIGGPYAKTFRFDIRGGESAHTVFAKICPTFGTLNPARLEYETLQILYPKMPEINPICRVARPIDFFPDLNAYAMESVGNHNFKTFLLKNNSRGKSPSPNLIQTLAGSAIWLKTFHQITRSTASVPFNFSHFLKSITEEFDYTLLRNFNFRSETFDLLQSLLADLSTLDGAFKLPCAKWHWDYTPGHIFLDHRKISVIDILGLDHAPIYEDIGHFMVALALVNNLPFYPFFDRRRAWIYFPEKFLSAYWTEGGPTCDRTEFMLFSKIYQVKYFLAYFWGQYTRVSEKIHPIAGKVFANHRSARLIEEPMVRAIREVGSLMKQVRR